MSTILTRGLARKRKLSLPVEQVFNANVRLCLISPTATADHYSAEVEGELLVRSSRQPFLDCARILVERGCDTNSILVMRRPGSDVNCLVGKIGVAAKLVVADSRHGTPKFRPHPGVVAARPIRLNGSRLSPVPVSASSAL